MSRLFARHRPVGVGRYSSAQNLLTAFAREYVSEELAYANLRDILDRLVRVHGFRLNEDDRRGVRKVYESFYRAGPTLRGAFGGGAWIPSYAALMAQTDLEGHNHGYLASEEHFRVLKGYQANNLIIPLVGDFSGDRTIRAVGQYLKEHDATVTTFYTSNVEEYLFESGHWNTFVGNASTLPVDERSTFIRAYFIRNDGWMATLIDPIRGTLNAVAAGQVHSYNDVVQRSKAPSP